MTSGQPQKCDFSRLATFSNKNSGFTLESISFSGELLFLFINKTSVKFMQEKKILDKE